MTSKKRRQRGSRTHGGGSHKNRRGAGNRGGRGAAGRSKHEQHNHEDKGSDGFNRPQKTEESVAEVNLEEISNYVLYNDVSQVVAEELADDGDDADVVKVLGRGRFQSEVEVIADAFTEPARKCIQQAGGDPRLPREVDEIKRNGGNNSNMPDDNERYFETVRGEVNDGKSLDPDEIHGILEESTATEELGQAYSIIVDSLENSEDLNPEQVVELYHLRYEAREAGLDITELESNLDAYFRDVSEGRKETLQQGVEDQMTPEEVAEGLETLEQEWEKRLGEDYSPLDRGLADAKKDYLCSVRNALG